MAAPAHLFFDPKYRTFIRYDSKTGTTVAVDQISGGKILTVTYAGDLDNSVEQLVVLAAGRYDARDPATLSARIEPEGRLLIATRAHERKTAQLLDIDALVVCDFDEQRELMAIEVIVPTTKWPGRDEVHAPATETSAIVTLVGDLKPNRRNPSRNAPISIDRDVTLSRSRDRRYYRVDIEPTMPGTVSFYRLGPNVYCGTIGTELVQLVFAP